MNRNGEIEICVFESEENNFSENGESADKKKKRKFTKTYVFYCVMTLSVMLFALAFAASELFALFFSEGYPGQMLVSKFFGFSANSEKSFKEILLETSFVDLSFKSSKEDLSGDNVASPPTDTAPDKDTAVTDKTESSVTGLPSVDTAPENEDIYAYDPTVIPDGMSGIIPMDLSLAAYGNNYINSSSILSVNPERLEKYSFSADAESAFLKNLPLVLIVHTHGSESYTDENVNFYDSTKEVSRSYDTDLNVVAVGRQIAAFLNSRSIPTIHCEIMHDINSYSGAYEESAKTVQAYLKKYPSIQYVIDVHRDAIVKSTGELVKTLCMTDAGKSAQVMCVVGTGANGNGCENWERNLALAQKLRKELNEKAENLCRPACLRDSAYNQQYAPYSILLEIGAAGNTLNEALNAAQYVADALVKIIKE